MFGKSILVVEQNNYVTEIVYACIVYHLDDSPKSSLNNFALKNCFFGVTNIVKSSDNSKYVCNSYGIAFEYVGNDFARNDAIFCVDDSSSSHVDNRNNNFLVSGDGTTDDINGSVGTAEKTFSINFSKAKTKFCLSLHYNEDNGYLFDNGKEK